MAECHRKAGGKRAPPERQVEHRCHRSVPTIRRHIAASGMIQLRKDNRMNTFLAVGVTLACLQARRDRSEGEP